MLDVVQVKAKNVVQNDDFEKRGRQRSLRKCDKQFTSEILMSSHLFAVCLIPAKCFLFFFSSCLSCFFSLIDWYSANHTTEYATSECTKVYLLLASDPNSSEQSTCVCIVLARHYSRLHCPANNQSSSRCSRNSSTWKMLIALVASPGAIVCVWLSVWLHYL